MRKLAITAAVGCTVITTVTAATTGVTSAATTGIQAPNSAELAVKTAAVTWTTCTSDRLAKAGAQCGLLSVPLDYAHPDGKKIQIALSRIKATAPKSKRQGPLLMNPGGPGGSGLGLAAYFADALPKKIASTFDLIGFDPRGVGDSKPALTCIPDFNKGPRPDYVPSDDGFFPAANEIAWLKRSAAYSAACAKNNAALLPHLTTVDAVKDIDQIRKSLGADKINYYGFSYGTYLGQIYSTMYPTHTRRLVFDGVVDPRNVWYDAQLDQDKAFERAMKEFFAWIAKHDDVYDLGATAAKVEKRYYKEQDKLRDHPVGQIGPSEWVDAILGAGYYQGAWPDTAGAIAAWTRGDTKPLMAAYADTASVGDDNGFAMYLGVQCVDSFWPRGYDKWRDDGFATAAVAPFETWGNVWFNMPCKTWAAPQGVPVDVDGSRTPSALLVNTTLDGATPYSGSLEVRRRFPHSALIAEVGSTTHADTLNGNECVDNRVFKYLATGALPTRVSGKGPDVECKASPLPTPNEADIKAAGADAGGDGGFAQGGDGGDGGNGGGSVDRTRQDMIAMWSRTRG